jgi:hypothetical protein
MTELAGTLRALAAITLALSGALNLVGALAWPWVFGWGGLTAWLGLFLLRALLDLGGASLLATSAPQAHRTAAAVLVLDLLLHVASGLRNPMVLQPARAAGYAAALLFVLFAGVVRWRAASRSAP